MARRRLPKFLRPREELALYAAARTDRERALLVLMLRCGLRVSEVVCLKVEDVDLEDRSLAVQLGKGKKDRDLPQSEEAAAILAVYIGPLGRRTGWLFPTGRMGSRGPRSASGHEDSKGVWKVVRDLGDLAGLAQRVWPHRLRHTFAMDLLRSGVPITQVSRLLGHSHIQTTAIYLDCETEQLKPAVDGLPVLGSRGQLRLLEGRA